MTRYTAELFSVHIWFWGDDIQTQLADYPNLVEKHFPQFKIGRQPEGYPWPRVHAMKYFIYLDIPGIENLAENIAEEGPMGDTIVRDILIDVINKKVNTIQTEGIAAQYYGKNEWHIAADNFDTVFSPSVTRSTYELHHLARVFLLISFHFFVERF